MVMRVRIRIRIRTRYCDKQRQSGVQRNVQSVIMLGRWCERRIREVERELSGENGWVGMRMDSWMVVVWGWAVHPIWFWSCSNSILSCSCCFLGILPYPPAPKLLLCSTLDRLVTVFTWWSFKWVNT